MRTIFALTLRQLTGRARLLVLTVLAGMPVLITAMVVSSASATSVGDYETAILSTLFAGSILPLVVLAIGSVAFANEIEDRTLANLTLSPVPRWQIALPKLGAAIAVSGGFIVACAALTSYLAYNADATAVFAVTTSALVAVVLYAAVFVWLGLVSPQAIGIGLAYIVLWEGLFAGLVSGVRLLSIRHYALAVMHALDPRRFVADTHLGTIPTVVVCVVLLMGLFALTVRRLRRMDVP